MASPFFSRDQKSLLRHVLVPNTPRCCLPNDSPHRKVPLWRTYGSCLPSMPSPTAFSGLPPIPESGTLYMVLSSSLAAPR